MSPAGDLEMSDSRSDDAGPNCPHNTISHSLVFFFVDTSKQTMRDLLLATLLGCALLTSTASAKATTSSDGNPRLYPKELVRAARAASKANPQLALGLTREQVLAGLERRELYGNDNINYNKPNSYGSGGNNNNYNRQSFNTNNNYGYNRQSNNYYNNNQQQQSQQAGYGGAFSGSNGNWQNSQESWNTGWNWDQDMMNEGFGFDISSYALKFQKCTTVESYNEDMANDQSRDTVLSSERFAVFRLCPKDQCSASSTHGCDKEYGEYVVSMDQYLEAVLVNEEQRVVDYCNYCQECAEIEAYKNFWNEVEFNRESALNRSIANYKTWLYNYYDAQEQRDYANGASYSSYTSKKLRLNRSSAGVYDETDVDLAEAYYKNIRDGSNYANNYYNQEYSSQSNYGNQNQMSDPSVQWTDQQFWMFQTSAENTKANYQKWKDMDRSSYGTFYGKRIINGHYDAYGNFQRGFGYFNGTGGFQSLEQPFEERQWDTNWGQMPEAWVEFTNMTESCLYQYAGSCYNQYDSCMSVLQDYDYWSFNNVNAGNLSKTYADYTNRSKYVEPEYRTYTFKSLINCTLVREDTDENNQELNQQLYEKKEEFVKANYNCYEGDTKCEDERDNALALYDAQLRRTIGSTARYVGPHCSTSGKRISLAVYKDAYCTVYDEKSSVTEMIGFDPSDDTDLVPNECIECGMNQEVMDQGRWYETEDMNMYRVEPLCSMLYQLSGKCNRKLPIPTTYTEAQSQFYENWETQQQQMSNGNDQGSTDSNKEDYEAAFLSAQQEANENQVCAFVDSLMSDSRDEAGQVVFARETFWGGSGNGRVSASKGVIVILAMAVIAMSVWASLLYGTYQRTMGGKRKKGEMPIDLIDACANETCVDETCATTDGHQLMIEEGQTDSMVDKAEEPRKPAGAETLL